MELKKGNVVFLTTVAADLFYIVTEVEGETVKAVKMDAPRSQVESLPLGKIVKLAEEQEKILPLNLLEAIESQRRVIFTPKPTGGKKKVSLKKLFERLPETAIEEILQTLDEIEERRSEEI